MGRGTSTAAATAGTVVKCVQGKKRTGKGTANGRAHFELGRLKALKLF